MSNKILETKYEGFEGAYLLTSAILKENDTCVKPTISLLWKNEIVASEWNPQLNVIIYMKKTGKGEEIVDSNYIFNEISVYRTSYIAGIDNKLHEKFISGKYNEIFSFLKEIANSIER